MFMTIWWSCSWFALSFVYSADRWLYFSVSWDMCCYKATNSLDWILDIDWKLSIVETLQVAHKFSAVVLERPYTRFLSAPWSNLYPQIRIKIRMGRRIVPISLPQPIIIDLLKMKVIIVFISIKIITYKIKWCLTLFYFFNKKTSIMCDFFTSYSHYLL